MENNNQSNIMVPATQIMQPIAVPHQYAQLQPPPIDLRRYWNILLKRKWWFLGFFLSVGVVGGLISFLSTPIYRATTVLQIIQDNPASIMGERDPWASLYGSETAGRFYETQYLILKSRPMVYKIMEALKMTEGPEFQKLQKAMPSESMEEIQSKFADRILDNLEIKPLKRSYLVEVAYKSQDKNLAQRVVNVISKEYMKFSMDTRQQSFELIKNWLEGELQTLATKVQDSEMKLYGHAQDKGILGAEGKDNVIVGKYVELNQLLTKAQSERMIREAQFQQIKEKGVDAPLITNNLLIQKIREQTIEQEANVSSLKKIYGDNYPQLQAERGKLRDLRASLDGEVKRIRTSIEADYGTALRAENLVREAVESQKYRVGELQSNLVKHHILKRDLQTNEQLYQALLARMKEANVSSTMVASNVAVVVPAEKPFGPFKPNKQLNLIIASLIGLIGGVGLAFLVDHFDDSIKSVEAMEQICQMPSLGLVPLLSASGKGKGEDEMALSAFLNPRSLVNEAIQQVRTSILLSSSEAPPAVLLVTSPNPNEGKTTISINISISLALNERKVVLIDADLRKPSIHKVFKQESQPGLSNFLTGSATFDEIVHPTAIPNLDIIVAGTIPPSPMELMSSKVFVKLVDELRRNYQHVIIDTPPIIAFADARSISTSCDGVLMVIKQDSTSRQSGMIATQLLMQVNARILGGVLNMAKINRFGYYSYYGYTQYYGSDQHKFIKHSE
jgi:succinoglycan biosynthesis transport protein ExoP